MSSSISLKKKKSLSAKGSSNSANSYKVNGNKLYYSKLFEEAIKCYDKAIVSRESYFKFIVLLIVFLC